MVSVTEGGIESKNNLSPTITELNQKQRDAILNENQRLLILAGAGSGKTSRKSLKN